MSSIFNSSEEQEDYLQDLQISFMQTSNIKKSQNVKSSIKNTQNYIIQEESNEEDSQSFQINDIIQQSINYKFNSIIKHSKFLKQQSNVQHSNLQSQYNVQYYTQNDKDLEESDFYTSLIIELQKKQSLFKYINQNDQNNNKNNNDEIQIDFDKFDQNQLYDKDPNIKESKYIPVQMEDKRLNKNLQIQLKNVDTVLNEKNHLQYDIRDFHAINDDHIEGYKIKNNVPHDGLISLYLGNVLQCKIAICVTMYNEDKQNYARTIKGVYQNIEKFNEIGIQNHEILIFIIQDGITKIHVDNKNPIEKCMLTQYKQVLDDPDGTQRFVQQQNRLDTIYDKIIYMNDIVKSKHEFGRMDEDQFIKLLKKNPNEQENFQEVQQFKQFLDEFNYINIQELNKLKQNEPITSEDIEKANIKSLQMSQNKMIQKYQGILKQFESKAILIQSRTKLEYSNIDNMQQFDQQLDELQKMQMSVDPDESVHVEQQKLIQEQEKQIQQLKEELEMQEINNIRYMHYLYQFFVVKFGNYKKLNSHLWFFSGFCELFNPQITVLLDCGCQPKNDSIVKMYLAFNVDPQIGGVCGYMGLLRENTFDISQEQKQHGILENLFLNVFDIQKAQTFEYATAHIYDKAFESSTGFIHVLPGAFSGYKWEALKHNKYGSILESYLKTEFFTCEEDKIEYSGVKEANKYLAEDRILCLKLYGKLGKAYKLAYLEDAVGWVDPVTNIIQLMGQRRRWINGTW